MKRHQPRKRRGSATPKAISRNHKRIRCADRNQHKHADRLFRAKLDKDEAALVNQKLLEIKRNARFLSPESPLEIRIEQTEPTVVFIPTVWVLPLPTFEPASTQGTAVYNHFGHDEYGQTVYSF